jgi:glutamate/tyrosine decarboxylase-like PLP-dependent enzyme
MVDGFTNNAMAIYEMGPAAAAIEYFLINWLLDKVGWAPAVNPEAGAHGGGVLTHGGSLANLTALIAARTRLVPEVWEEGNPADLAILAPAASHLARAPTVCAAVLVRDASSLDRAFQQEASYLFHDKDQPGFDFNHRTVECTKAGLGLRFFAVLAAMGERGLADYMEGLFRVTREAYERIAGEADFECAAAPQANILCFRFKADDPRQMALRARILAEGSFYLSTATHGGKRWLCLVIMNPDTRLRDVERLLAR